MFDPTIFDNLKTVLEGHVYEQDFAGQILVIERQDLFDLATLKRQLVLGFRSRLEGEMTAQLQLTAPLQQLAAEILELQEPAQLGCDLQLFFQGMVHHDPAPFCAEAGHLLEQDWGGRLLIVPTISYTYGLAVKQYEVKFQCLFQRKIGEAQIADLPMLVQLAVTSLTRLNALHQAGVSER